MLVRKWIKRVSIMLILYLILGALLPFMFHPKAEVSEAGQKAAELVTKAVKEKNKNLEKNYLGRADIIETSMDALNVRLQMIEEAKESIILSTFDIRTGKSAKDIFAFLLAAADRGVKVEILVDGMSVFTNMRQEAMFYAAGLHENITIRAYNQPNPVLPWTWNGRMHDKYIIVDQEILLAGGRNTFDYFLGEYNIQNLSFDREVLIYEEEVKKKEGTAIPQVMEYYQKIIKHSAVETVYHKKPFFKDQKEIEEAKKNLYNRHQKILKEKAELFQEKGNYRNHTVPIEESIFLTNPTGILAKKPVLYRDLIAMMEAANQRIFIQTPYVVLSKDMKNLLANVCKGEVPIAMEVNAIAVGDNVMASSDYLFRRKQILETGVHLYEFQGEHSSHGKSLLIDQEISVIGSFNFDMRSAYLDTETMFVIKGAEFQNRLAEHMEAMHKQSIKVLRTNEYKVQQEVKEAVLPKKKELFYRITSVLFQLIRYLI